MYGFSGRDSNYVSTASGQTETNSTRQRYVEVKKKHGAQRPSQVVASAVWTRLY